MAGTYQMTRGIHIENGADGKERVYRAPPPNSPPGTPACIFESKDDLERKNGGGGMYPKFIKLDATNRPVMPQLGSDTQVSKEAITAEIARLQGLLAQPPAAPASVPKGGLKLPPNLGNLTLDQLRSFAEAEEVDLKGAKTRDEALKVIKGLAN